jgi:hypothetical protein
MKSPVGWVDAASGYWWTNPCHTNTGRPFSKIGLARSGDNYPTADIPVPDFSTDVHTPLSKKILCHLHLSRQSFFSFQSDIFDSCVFIDLQQSNAMAI